MLDGALFRQKGDINMGDNNKDLKFRELSLNGNMWKVILYVGVPLALYQCLHQIFSILDTMMASHISSSSVSAVAYLSQIITIIKSIGQGLAVGGSIQISNAFGKGNYDLVKKRTSTLYALTAVIDVLLLIMVMPFLKQIMVISGLAEDLIPLSVSYFRVQIISTFFSFFNSVYISIERARGNSKRILYLNLFCILTKLSLTALFVYVLDGDLVTIAYATLISEMVLFIFSLKGVFEKGSLFSFTPKNISTSALVVKPMISKSIPVIFEKALFAFGKTVVNSMSKVFGSTMVGAMGVSNNLGGITTNPQNGFQEGSASIISQNYGAGKYKRVIECFWKTAVITMLIGAVVSGLELLNLDFLSSLFSSDDPEFQQMIITVYRYEAFGAVPLGLVAACMSLLYGLGKTRLTLIINLARVFLFRIPVFWLLINYTSVGQASCGYIMFISNFSTAVLSLAIALVVLVNFKREHNLTR